MSKPCKIYWEETDEKMVIRIPKIRLSFSEEFLVGLAFVLYFSNGLIRFGMNFILGAGTLSKIISIGIAYVPVFLLCVYKPRKYIKPDVVLLYVGIALFFYITLIIHPEYEYYYKREIYGIWPHVFIPYRGIYAYLFIRLANSAEKIIKYMKISGWLMFLDFGYQIITALRRGYWYGVAGNDQDAKMPYSVSFGYEVLPFALVFLYGALKHRKPVDILGTVISIAMILAGGSRGPIFCIALFLVLYVMVELKETRHKGLIITGIASAGAIVFLLYEKILLFVAELVSKFGLSSRFITSLVEGEIADDNGRQGIWEAAINMIAENPFGYGAYGTRHVIYYKIVAGYPHNIILEILVEFGVIIGGLLICVFIWNILRILFTKSRNNWIQAFLPFLCTTSALMLSLTYWSVPSFWATLAIGVNCAVAEHKGENKRRLLLDKLRRKLFSNGK